MKLLNMFTIILLLTSLATADALQATLCHCNETVETEILQFDDVNCDNEAASPRYQEIIYYVHTDRPEPLNVSATICIQWYRQKIVDRNIWGEENFVINTVPKHTSEEDCRTMMETYKCDQHYMFPVSPNKMLFSSDPVEAGVRGSQSVIELLNCAMQKVNLTSPCPSCPLYSPIGPVEASTDVV